MKRVEKKTKLSRLALFALAIVVGLAGLAMAEQAKLFSHKQHVEMELDCGYCHLGGDKGLKAQTEKCAECHEESMLPVKLSGEARKMRIVFDHERHAEAFACKDCHAATAADSLADGAPMMNKPKCDSCHSESGIEINEANCSACHPADIRRQKPQDHLATWIQRHGKAGKWRQFDDHGKDCTLCHSKSACISCHREQRPADHTGLWRMQTHGKAAEWDNDRCDTCHESGSCVRCHRDTRPYNHRGSWRFLHGRIGWADNCFVCHTPAQATHCKTCHTN